MRAARTIYINFINTSKTLNFGIHKVVVVFALMTDHVHWDNFFFQITQSMWYLVVIQTHLQKKKSSHHTAMHVKTQCTYCLS